MTRTIPRSRPLTVFPALPLCRSPSHSTTTEGKHGASKSGTCCDRHVGLDSCEQMKSRYQRCRAYLQHMQMIQPPGVQMRSVMWSDWLGWDREEAVRLSSLAVRGTGHRGISGSSSTAPGCLFFRVQSAKFFLPSAGSFARGSIRSMLLHVSGI
jgi:hypothetical protein